MFTDIYGYSRLMSMDEQKAMAMLAEHDRIVDPLILSGNGRIIKKMGDAVLADFASPTDALRAALRIQNELKVYNGTRSKDERIIIRIGLHTGNVIMKDNDLFGQDVNVTARLETLADPGGICISESMYDAVKETLDANIVSMGNVSLKNIIQKYVVYKIPSFYGDEFTKKNEPETPGMRYRIERIVNIPVRYLAPADLLILTVLVCLLFLVVAGYLTLGRIDLESMLLLLRERGAGIAATVVMMALSVIYFYANKSVRIVFGDIRDADALMEFLVTQIGYTISVRQDNALVFRPTLYQFIMYSARKIHCVIEGNAVTISGNYMFILKLMKLVRACDTGV